MRGGDDEDLRVRAANNGKLVSSADVYRVRCDDDVIATDVTLMGEVSDGFAIIVLTVGGDQLLSATFFFSTLQLFCRSRLGQLRSGEVFGDVMNERVVLSPAHSDEK